MYIKSMVIDGFKSYGQRTEIVDFDRTFNAITGLNGSGKSNILDAICFLLGISNLSQVRAANLQDLIYKSGQAGIQKASVSITFDNNDKSQCPVGYETHNSITVTRQIVMGGRNKYLINGTAATNNRVQDLFGSVQLNVNNPHFLIMQGRVTKVLNMKPQEILLMIEEAAGTRMYETKRQNAQKLIEKKDAKLNDINVTLQESIIPTIQRLKEERQSYLEYTKTMRELEHLTKFYVAWQFNTCLEVKERSENEIHNITNAIANGNEEKKGLIEANMEIDENVKKAEMAKDKEDKGKLKGLEDELKEKQLAETKVCSKIKNIEENLKAEAKKIKETEKHLNNDTSALEGKKKELENLMNNCQGILAKGKNDADNYEAAQKHVEALSTGLSTNEDGEAATLADQLMNAQSEIARCDAEFKMHELNLKQAQKDINEKRQNCKLTENAYKQDDQKYKALFNDLEVLRKKLDTVGYSNDVMEQLANQQMQLQREIRQMENQCDSIQSQYPNLCFEYRNPQPNFDRNKVHGFVAKLLKLKDNETSTALEVVAGGKLYNVVIDNEVTGKLLLEKGNLKRRHTFIPLNKISSYVIDQRTLSAAENLVGKGNVWTALSLIEYDPSVEAAMKYTFGGTLVCRTMDQGKKIAFHPSISKRTVTLEGDVFDPSGTLTGGASSKGPSVLIKMSQLKEVEVNLKRMKQEIVKINHESDRIKAKKNQYDEAKVAFNTKENEAKMIKTRLEMSSHHQLLEELKQLELDVQTLENTDKENRVIKKRMQNKVKELEFKIKDAKAFRERDLKQAEENLVKLKKESEKSKKEYQEKQNEVNSLKLEIEEIIKATETDKQQMEDIEKAIVAYTEETKVEKDNLAVAKSEIEEVVERINMKRKEIACHSEEIEALQAKRNDNEDQISHLSVKIKQLQHDLTKTQREAQDAEKKVDQFLQQYEWIEQEQQYFGKPNTEYDFRETDPKEVGRKISQLKEHKDRLSKSVNTRAQNMMNKSENEYQDLIKKKKMVEMDKAKLLEIIQEMDEKKRNALIVAWEKVNKDFGSIFSLLLNNAQAKLMPPEGKSVLDGLEVKVAFNNTWKESLNELSGGQRSLVALSLVLAMLLFKPAPIYILDEVDAALDISHTQNIGQMLRTHFRSSQFIIVSLKDGMFNNANVLFKTKFVDGNSCVTRHTQHAVE